MNGLFLVVARGRDAGSRFFLDPSARFLGRALDVDHVLRDPRVSRRHLSVRAEGDVAIVESCSGAAPFVHEGSPCRAATLRVGDTIIVGDTALVIQLGDAPSAAPPARPGAATTDVMALMSGLAADVRGLAAVVSLVEALDAAVEEPMIRDALERWGREYVGASHVALLVDESIAAELGDVGPHATQLIERASLDGNSTTLAVLASVGAPAWAAFTCDVQPASVSHTARRLVVVAGRLCASALARVRAARVVDEDREFFRRGFVGSARSFLGDSPAARDVDRLVQRLATTDAIVLIEGETGAGKTFLARLLHESGPRARAPLRVLNCAAIPDALVESELFGHERGAFTGALTSRVGALEAAGEGTILLDEIGELPLASQAKLLRVVEERRFERLGSNRSIPFAARVLAATNRDLEAMVKEGTFRHDLYYRIAVVKLRVPALRERGDDLLVLASRILADLAPSSGRRVDGFSNGALDAIRRYRWPGNVRELRNAIERALVVGERPLIEAGDLPEIVLGAPPRQPDDESLVRLPADLRWLENRAIEAALRSTDGNQRRAALLLGINRVTLNRKLRDAKAGEDDE